MPLWCLDPDFHGYGRQSLNMHAIKLASFNPTLATPPLRASSLTGDGRRHDEPWAF
ncbi:hypothetical protein CaCOL14_006525 [Colletotrichum acutatum]